MTEANRRKKDPEGVRRCLIRSAARLAVKHGFSSLCIEAIASGAGVTKGGFFHHFASKQAMVEAVFLEVVSGLDHAIDEELAGRPNEYGCFTRAYINAIFKLGVGRLDEQGIPISLSMLTDPSICKRWTEWRSERLKRHAETDRGVALEIVRMAVDGLWLTIARQSSVSDSEEIRERLLAATRRRVE